jgi:hypothetical protein
VGAKVGVCNAMYWARAREKNLLMGAHFIGRWNNFAAGRTNTARVLEDFGQDETPSFVLVWDCFADVLGSLFAEGLQTCAEVDGVGLYN